MGKNGKSDAMGEVVRMTAAPNVEQSRIEVRPNGAGGVIVRWTSEGPVTHASFRSWTHDQEVEIERDYLSFAARAFKASSASPAAVVAAIEAFLTPSERGFSDVLDTLDRDRIPYVFRSESDGVEERR
jgi:hypothetical protein